MHDSKVSLICVATFWGTQKRHQFNVMIALIFIFCISLRKEKVFVWKTKNISPPWVYFLCMFLFRSLFDLIPTLQSIFDDEYVLSVCEL